MTVRSSSLALAIGLTASCAAAAADKPAFPDTASGDPALRQEVDQLRAEVKELRDAKAVNTAGTDAAIQAVLDDANRRSQFLAAGPGAVTYDNGLYITGDDGNFKMHPWLQFMPRFVANYRQDAKHGDDSDIETGFEIRRMKLGFDGNVFSKDLMYNVVWATDRKSGALILEEAWIKDKISDEFAVTAGQFKDPFAHEGLTSSKKLLAAERTYLDDVMGLGDNFIQGIFGSYSTGAFNIALGYTDGTRSNNTNFQDPPANSTNFGFVGRVEYMIAGDPKLKEYDDFSAMGNKADLFVIGAAFDWTQAGDTDVLLHTVDAQWENTSGFGLYGAFLGRYTRNGPTTGGSGDFYDWGVVLQVAYALPDTKWELFGRYDYTGFSRKGLLAGNERHVHEFTVGANYYMHGQNAKLTMDVTYLPNGAPIADDGSGVLASDGKDELMFRIQWQLVI